MNETIKINRNELYNIYEILKVMTGGNKVKYFVKKNKDYMIKELNLIVNSMKTSVEGIKEYENKAREILNKWVTPDDKGETKATINEDGTVNIKEEYREEYQSFLKELNEKHKDDLDAREEEVVKFNKFMIEEIEIQIYKISNDLIPDELSKENYEIIFPLIRELVE